MEQKKQDNEERNRTRRENLAKYYLDLSKLTFAALVLGSASPIFTGQGANIAMTMAVMACGIATTAVLAVIGNRILK